MSDVAVLSEEVSLAEPLFRLGKDIRKASRVLTWAEARWLVDTYYQMQDGRIRSKGQLDRQEEQAEPNELITWVFKTWRRFEDTVQKALLEFSSSYRVGNWMLQQYGIGPVLSAAMLTNFDIRQARTVGHFWAFAGFDPTRVWEKGEKRPYNAELKSICAYKMGECFVKFQNRELCFYGHLFATKKAELAERNKWGDFQATAKAEIARCQESKSLLSKMEKTARWKHWKEGNLCPQHIHDRARRWTVKIFLSHLHEVMYWDYFQLPPPVPFVFRPENGDHRHKIDVPLWKQEWHGQLEGRGLRELYGEAVHCE